MKIKCKKPPIVEIGHPDIEIDISSQFSSELRLKLTRDYYSSFRNANTRFYDVLASDYLNGTDDVWPDPKLLCPEMPVPVSSAGELSIRAETSRAVAFVHAGRSKCMAPVHFDWDHTWISHACLTGVKRFFLFRPEAAWLLNPIINTSALCVPKFSESDRKEIVTKLGGAEILLRAGEGILFPSLYWHGVLYEESSLSVSVRFEASPRSRPFAALPRSWLLQRLIWKFFKDDFDKKSTIFLQEYLNLFFQPFRSWKDRYFVIMEFCRQTLRDLGEQRGVDEWVGQNFSSEVSLASKELKFYYGFDTAALSKHTRKSIKDVGSYLFSEASHGIVKSSEKLLASYALEVRQGLIPKRGIININRGK